MAEPSADESPSDADTAAGPEPVRDMTFGAQRRRRRRLARAARRGARAARRRRREVVPDPSTSSDAPRADAATEVDQGAASTAVHGPAGDDTPEDERAAGVASGSEPVDPGSSSDDPDEVTSTSEPVAAESTSDGAAQEPDTGGQGAGVRADGGAGKVFLSHPTEPPTAWERHRRAVLLVGAIVLLAVAGILAAVALAPQTGPEATDSTGRDQGPPPPGGWQPSVLLATTDGQDHLRSLALLASDRRSSEGTVLLLPPGTVTDVPGFGTFTLGEAWEFGGASLVAVTVDNLLGVHLDGVVGLDPAAWENWLEPVGPVGVDVPSRIVPADEQRGGGFEAGSQQLGPEAVGDYLVVRGQGETELQALARTQQVMAGLFAAIRADETVLDSIATGALELPGTVTPQQLRTVLGELADVAADDDLATVTLPVVPLGSGDEEVYRADPGRVEELMEDRFAASREQESDTQRLAVQILNGNGEPGIGQDVAERLADGPYRIVLTGNADRFTHPETRILVYRDEPSDVRAARDIRERLGTGTVERSGTPQSVVDITIVVGRDFQPD